MLKLRHLRQLLYMNIYFEIHRNILRFCAPADHEKSVKRSLASRFRRMFMRNEVNITAGRGALFRAFPRTDKAR